MPLKPISWTPAEDSPPGYIDISDRLREKLRNTGGSYWHIDYVTTDSFETLKERIAGKGWILQTQMAKSDRVLSKTVTLTSSTALYVKGEEPEQSLLSVFLNRDGRGDFYVWSPNQDDNLSETLVTLVDAIPIPEPRVRDETPIQFSFLGGNGPAIKQRFIHTPHFADIVQNYSPTIQPQLTRLATMNLSETPTNGRVIILHGPAGTGKTTLLRGLAREWREWANLRYIIDPEMLFANPTYLYSLLEAENRGKWGFILFLEDVDEFIGPNAKATTGQAFSRLLNLADGFLGQGLNMLLVMTTNIKLGEIQPALQRQGRCMANIEVGRFSADEARTWLGTGKTGVVSPMTLAEMYARKGTIEQVTSEKAKVQVGTYL